MQARLDGLSPAFRLRDCVCVCVRGWVHGLGVFLINESMIWDIYKGYVERQYADLCPGYRGSLY